VGVWLLQSIAYFAVPLSHLLPHPPPTSPHPFTTSHRQVLAELIERHQRARAAVSDEIVDAFMSPRAMSNLFG
jgi:hypothetical protein